ncbi:MAG: low temperature requirement protein A [Candidatus Nanopelagicales bacterium]
MSFLELFYDLVFVVLVAQIAHSLAEDASWSGVAGFVVVFAIIWIAWFNGSLYYEAHAREDGRARISIFVQMFLLVALAAIAARATDENGAVFAGTYAALLAVLAWQWWSVGRHDVLPAYRPWTVRYVVGLLGAIGNVLVSIFAVPTVRELLWAAMVVVWVLGLGAQNLRSKDHPLGVTATEALAERFGLFTILVLGEVVVGVVDGMSAAGGAALTLVTGLLALSVGFGFWWNYFEAIGRLPPRRTAGAFTAWTLTHLPLTAAILITGAGMVSLIEHESDARTPFGTAWLLAGPSTALLVLLAVLITTIDYEPARAELVGPVSVALGVGAVGSVAVGLLRPQAWILALLLVLIHAAT